MKTIGKVRANYRCDKMDYETLERSGERCGQDLKRHRNRTFGRLGQFADVEQCDRRTNSAGGDSDSGETEFMDQIQVPAISCNYSESTERDRDENEEEGFPDDGDDEEDAQAEEHIFEPMSGDAGQQTIRPCLAWACKACKKKSVAVDRRKAATLRERRRLRKVGDEMFMCCWNE